MNKKLTINNFYILRQLLSVMLNGKPNGGVKIHRVASTTGVNSYTIMFAKNDTHIYKIDIDRRPFELFGILSVDINMQSTALLNGKVRTYKYPIEVSNLKEPYELIMLICHCVTHSFNYQSTSPSFCDKSTFINAILDTEKQRQVLDILNVPRSTRKSTRTI